MKILFLSFYSGLSHRGAETYVHHLANGLVQKKHQVTVIQTGSKLKSTHYETQIISSSTFPSTPSTTNIFRRLFITPRQLSETFFYLKSFRYILKNRPEIIIQLNTGLHLPLLRLLTFILGIKLVIPGQSGLGWDDRWNLLWHPDVFIALTDYQLKWAQEYSWSNQRLKLIPNGVDLSQFSPHGKKIKLNLQKPIVLISASSTPNKRVEESIRAVSKLNRGSLLHLGTGPQDKYLNNLGSKLLGSKRFLQTSVTHAQIAAYYRSVNLFTLCSDHSEAFGIVYLEALASGLPIVATDDPSRHFIVGKAGVYLKDPNNISQYAKSIKLALTKKWSTLPRSQAKKFSWTQITQSYLDLFSDLTHL